MLTLANVTHLQNMLLLENGGKMKPTAYHKKGSETYSSCGYRLHYKARNVSDNTFERLWINKWHRKLNIHKYNKVNVNNLLIVSYVNNNQTNTILHYISCTTFKITFLQN